MNTRQAGGAGTPASVSTMHAFRDDNPAYGIPSKSLASALGRNRVRTATSRLSHWHASGNKTDIEFQAKTIETIVEAFPMTALCLG